MLCCTGTTHSEIPSVPFSFVLLLHKIFLSGLLDQIIDSERQAVLGALFEVIIECTSRKPKTLNDEDLGFPSGDCSLGPMECFGDIGCMDHLTTRISASSEIAHNYIKLKVTKIK